MKYREFMDTVYIPYYRSYVETSTFNTRYPALQLIIEKFGDLKLREISVTDVDNFKIWLLTDENNGGSGYSQSYASLVFGMFRKTLDKAVERNFLEYNISKSKGNSERKANCPILDKDGIRVSLATNMPR